MKKVIINGGNGRMGQAIARIIANQPQLNLEIVAVREEGQDVHTQADVVIDFSQSVIIPLYSMKNGEKTIFSKSGLNQWNAGGRARDYDEVYIPFNSTLREMYEGFFPPRDTPFEVILPNGETMSMKLCQENCKALMSNPNKALGKWLLRDVLKVPYGQIITYQDLLEIGIDSVSFKKIEDKKYMLDFKNVGEFKNFINKEYMSDIDN